MLFLFRLVHLDKIINTTVIGTFNGIRKETCGKFISTPMITQTLATEPFSATRITAITRIFVLLNLTFHHPMLSLLIV